MKTSWFVCRNRVERPGVVLIGPFTDLKSAKTYLAALPSSADYEDGVVQAVDPRDYAG